MNRVITNRLALCALLVLLAPWALAQRMGGTMPHMAAPSSHASTFHGASVANTPPLPGFEGIQNHFLSGRGGREFSRFRDVSPFEPGYFPLLSDWFTPQDLYAAGYPVAAPLPYGVEVYEGPAASVSDRQPQPPSESLLIELQGDRYVRVNEIHAENAAEPLTQGSPDVAAAPAATPLAAVVLVFRDGTRQEVRDYAITDGVLYARGDLYTDGYWNKKIELASLNLPETIKSNQERGVQFLLPSAPNEVITRP